MNAPLNPSDIARETLGQLAKSRVAPTPDNYREHYHRISGQGVGAQDAELTHGLARFADQLPGAGPRGDLRAALRKALADNDRQGVCALLLKLAQTDAQPERQDSREWTKMLRALLQSFDTNHPGWTRARKREAMDTLLHSAPRDPDALLARLRSLVGAWKETPNADSTAATTDSAAVPARDAPGNNAHQQGTHAILVRELRDCLVTTLDVALPALLGHASGLAEEARALAARVRLADDEAALAGLAEEVHLFAGRTQSQAGGDGQIREGLLRLLRLIVDNLRELVEGDHWIQAQAAVIGGVLAGPLSAESIGQAEQAIKALMLRQGALRRTLEEAQASLKSLLRNFIVRLGVISDDTGAYKLKLETYSVRLQKTDTIAALNDVIRDLMRDTDSMHEATDKSSAALAAAREQVEAAEVRVLHMERELELMSEQALEDQLTGTLNRRGLDDAFKREAARADRQNAPMCVAVLDIDDFKKLNDALGHQGGEDRAIQESNRRADDALRIPACRCYA